VLENEADAALARMRAGGVLALEQHRSLVGLFKAGDQAGRIAADAEALEHFRQAEAAYLKVYGDRLAPLPRAALARKVGAALHGTGQYERAHEQMRQALGHLGIAYPTTRGGVRMAILRYLGGHLLGRARSLVGLKQHRDIDTDLAAEVSTIAHLMAWMDYFLDKERMLLDSLIELHVGEHQALPVHGDTLLFLDKRLDDPDGVMLRDVQRDGLSVQHLHENLEVLLVGLVLLVLVLVAILVGLVLVVILVGVPGGPLHLPDGLPVHHLHDNLAARIAGVPLVGVLVVGVLLGCQLLLGSLLLPPAALNDHCRLLDVKIIFLIFLEKN
jgi:hypothetical protein